MDIIDVETGSQPLTERQTTTKRSIAAKKLRKSSAVQNTSAAVKDTGPSKPGKYYSGSYERY